MFRVLTLEAFSHIFSPLIKGITNDGSRQDLLGT